MTPGATWLLALGLLGSVGACDRGIPAAEEGARLFRDPGLSTGPFNRFSCATCHAVNANAPPVVPDRYDSGYNLANVVGRPSWWGGNETRLLDAVNVCLDEFMGGRRLAATDHDALHLYAFLEASSPEPRSAAAPFTVAPVATALADLPGSVQAGRRVYDLSCRRCHGEPHTGAGRLGKETGIIPEDTRKQFPNDTRAAVVEKIRHGRFFGVGGIMPLYSVQAMNDQEIADVLAFLGL